MNKYVMVLSCDWADEFTVEALQIATLEEINSFKNRLDKFKDKNLEGIEIYYGTNEFITFDSVEEISNSITIHEVPCEFADTLEKIIGYRSLGLINILDLPYYYERYE